MYRYQLLLYSSLTVRIQITNIKFPASHFGRARVAFIEFGDEEAMKQGLAKHAEV